MESKDGEAEDAYEVVYRDLKLREKEIRFPEDLE